MTTLKTERLILRPWKERDLAPFGKMNADAKVREFFPSLLTQEQSDQTAKKIQDEIEKLGYGFWAVEIPKVADFIGFIGLHHVSYQAHFTPAIEIGWRLDVPYWGKGYATEGALRALEYAFDELCLKEIVSFTTVTNIKSRKVMEKIGMHRKEEDDFHHPLLPEGHPLSLHVLYKIYNTK